MSKEQIHPHTDCRYRCAGLTEGMLALSRVDGYDGGYDSDGGDPNEAG